MTFIFSRTLDKLLVEGWLFPETTKGAFNQHTGGKVPDRQIGETPTPRFTANTAVSTGKSERVIQRSIQRVEDLGEDNAKAIMGTSLAKGVEMDALIKLPEPERKELIERAVAGPQV